MDIIYGYYMNLEEDRQRKAELKIERRFLRSRFEPLNLPDREFRKMFRLTKELYLNLVDELTPHMALGQRRTKLSIHTRILAALRFFATGSYQRGVGAEHNIAIGQQTMSKVITEVAIALQHIAPRWIKYPVPEEQKQEIQAEFMDRFGFPGAIGIIDGTHIAILEPIQDEHIYFNRKGFHSKNVQLICDARLTILNVNANYGGSAHDSFIWRQSAINEHLQQEYGRHRPRHWLIGDSGYPQQPWLMTPVTNTPEGTPERRYDDAHKVIRNCIERCIGTLKTRWRCLLKERVLRYDPHKVGVIVNSCCVLHNICIFGNVPLEEELDPHEEIVVDRGPEQYLFPENIVIEGRRQRQNIINLYFT